MPSSPESVKYSIESSQVNEPKTGIYVYDRDIPTKIRPHDRHRLVAIGDPPVLPIIGRRSPCPCQLDSEAMPNTPFATGELEKEYWSKRHLTQHQRDLDKELLLQKGARQRPRARKAATQKGKDKGEGSAQTTIAESSDSDVKIEGERRRQQRAGGRTASESAAERAKSDRKRRENDKRLRELDRINRVRERKLLKAQNLPG